MDSQDPDVVVGASLRRPLGGRLRAFRPVGGHRSRLDRIRKALLRGELSINGLNRWRLSAEWTSGVQWTFTSPGTTGAVAKTEAAITRREAGELSLRIADERDSGEVRTRIDGGLERWDLLYVLRDWSRVSDPCPSSVALIEVARQRGIAVHVIAAFGEELGIRDCRDNLYSDARRICRSRREPLLGPAPLTSRIERAFGHRLKDAGLEPLAQFPVAQYYLDFAVCGESGGLPVRLDVEVDGRYWHEELPNRLRPRDEQRGRLLRLFGWRPVRFWTDEIETDIDGCVQRVGRERVSDGVTDSV